jgi:hypothetical protein
MTENALRRRLLRQELVKATRKDPRTAHLPVSSITARARVYVAGLDTHAKGIAAAARDALKENKISTENRVQ